MVDDIGIQVVESFLDNFDIAVYQTAVTPYMGQYESGAEFAQQMQRIAAKLVEICQVG